METHDWSKVHRTNTRNRDILPVLRCFLGRPGQVSTGSDILEVAPGGEMLIYHTQSGPRVMAVRVFGTVFVDNGPAQSHPDYNYFEAKKDLMDLCNSYDNGVSLPEALRFSYKSVLEPLSHQWLEEKKFELATKGLL